MSDKNEWCGICERTTLHTTANVCLLCGYTTPLCPNRECRQPLVILETEEGDLAWVCEPCGIDYSRQQFPIPAAILREHAMVWKAHERNRQAERDREALEAWKAASAWSKRS